MNATRRVVSFLSAFSFAAVTGQGQVTELVSVSSTGVHANSTTTPCSVSADGRWIAFLSHATNLVPADTNGEQDIFVRDRQTATTEIVSVSSAGVQGDSHSESPSISPDGRYVAFQSFSSNLASGDANAQIDVFLRDRTNGTTEIVSLASGGTQGNGNSFSAALAQDASFIAFGSAASNLVALDTNGEFDVFVRDRVNGTLARISVATGGAQGNGRSESPVITPDGRYVAFTSSATNLVAGDTNGAIDVFVHDRMTGTTERVSVASGGVQWVGASSVPSISADGRFVAFQSTALSTDPGAFDVYVHDRASVTTAKASVTPLGMNSNFSSHRPSLSHDGRWLAFASGASDLVSGDTNVLQDVFVRDLLFGTTELVSRATNGVLGNGASFFPSLSGDGMHVGFTSAAYNLHFDDPDSGLDVLVRSLAAGGIASLCEAGSAGVMPCPCSNPPAGAGRGCDNAAGTGGAALSATGTPSLSADNVVLTAIDEPATATSIVLQGNYEVPGGFVFGQGLSCANGQLFRLYLKTASGGSISAPDVPGGDPSLAARAAEFGDVIQPGQGRFYLVYYRSPIVLGGCPATSTFNATQTLRVIWRP